MPRSLEPGRCEVVVVARPLPVDINHVRLTRSRRSQRISQHMKSRNQVLRRREPPNAAPVNRRSQYVRILSETRARRRRIVVHQIHAASRKARTYQHRKRVRRLNISQRLKIDPKDKRVHPVQRGRKRHLILPREVESSRTPRRSQRTRTQRSVVTVAADIGQNRPRTLQEVVVHRRTRNRRTST